MRVRELCIGLFCFALTSVVAETGARAAMTAPQSVTIPNTTETSWMPGTPSLAGLDPMMFNRFDPALGTLTAVDVTMSYSLSRSISMSFTTPSTITIVAAPTTLALEGPLGGTLSLKAPVDSVTYQQAGLPGQTYSTSEPVGSQFYLAPVGLPHNTPNLPFTGTLSSQLTKAPDLTLFTGPGSVGLNASAIAGISTITSSTGNGSGSVNTFAGLTVTVQYEYAAVPEPSSVALLGLGGGGLLLLGRMRRRVHAA
jgi:hypothetical protein